MTEDQLQNKIKKYYSILIRNEFELDECKKNL